MASVPLSVAPSYLLLQGIPGNNYGGFQAPDVVANLRIDQAWGSAQIMGALHDVNATYYSGLALAQLHWRAATRTTKSVG